MSLFGSLMADVEDDPFFGSHMRHMHQMNNMMNSILSDPFGMFGGGRLAVTGRHGGSLMPFMPQMPSLNRLFSADLDGGMGAGSSFSSSTVVMSSGPGGKPQVYSSTSSTKIGPNGVKETRKTLQDTRTGTKKMSIGHHIGERAHVIEREQNFYSGDAEERQEFINLDEDEAEDFDREFQEKAGSYQARRRPIDAAHPPRLAIAAAPAPANSEPSSSTRGHPRSHYSSCDLVDRRSSLSSHRPSARKTLRTSSNVPSSSAGVRDVYGGPTPQRHRPRQPRAHRADH